MVLIVEDATGLATSESYISTDYLKTYHKERGTTITAGGTELEQVCRLGTEYIDLRWGKKAPGNPIAEDQALCFPTDYYITDPVSLPLALQRACAEFSYYAIANDLFLDNSMSDGPGVTEKMEQIGPIITQTKWSGGGQGSVGRSYPIVSKGDALMRQLIGSLSGGVYR